MQSECGQKFEFALSVGREIPIKSLRGNLITMVLGLFFVCVVFCDRWFLLVLSVVESRCYRWLSAWIGRNFVLEYR